MTVLSNNSSHSNEYRRGSFVSTNEDVVMVSSPQVSTTSVSIANNTIEQAALYYSPLLTAATCFSVLANHQDDNAIQLDEGSNISAHSLHDDSMLVDHDCFHDESTATHYTHYQTTSCSPLQFTPNKEEYKTTLSNSTQTIGSMQNGASHINCNSLISLNDNTDSNSLCIYNTKNDADTSGFLINNGHVTPSSFNKLCMPSSGEKSISTLTNVYSKNNNSSTSTNQINTLSIDDQKQEEQLLLSNNTSLSPPLNQQQPFEYQPFLKNPFSLSATAADQQENPVKSHSHTEDIINNKSKKKQVHHYHHSHHQNSNQHCCVTVQRTATQDPTRTTLDSQHLTTNTSHQREHYSAAADSDNNSNHSTSRMGNTIINHYFPNEVHPLGFIEMIPNCPDPHQQNNERLSSFHQQQYAVNYDNHQQMMMANGSIMKEMMVLDEKNMTTTLTHSSSHSSLTHLSRFNGLDIKSSIGNEPSSLTDLPFEMILHIITFIPHQDDWCHEYNTYWNIREKYLKKLHTEAKQSVHNQFSKKRFVKNLLETAKSNPSRISISSRDSMDDEYQYMSQTKYGIFSICFVNNYMYHTYFKNVHFWKLICESYFNISKTDSLEPPVDKKLLNTIYSKQLNGSNNCPTSKIAKLGDWLQGMLNISNASEFSNMAIDENMGSFQVTGAVQNSGSNANFFISNPPVQEELVWWQYSYHYLHSIPARFDLNPNCLLPIFQVSPKNAINEDPNLLNISGLAKESEITKNSVLYNTCISRLMETDNKKSPNDYRWRNATSEQTFTPNNLYYFEFYVEKIGGINLGVGIVPNIHFTGSDNSIVPNDFNPSHYDNFIWPSGSCHHCFEINNQRYYSGDVVGMLVDYSYSEKNVLKIHFCHNWHSKEKRSALENQLKKVADLETYCQDSSSFEQNVFSSLLQDEINDMKNGVKSKDTTDEDDINYPFKENQIRLIYFTDDTQTQFPECVIAEGRNELISFMKVNPNNPNHSSTLDKKKKEEPKKWDLQKERPQPSQKELSLPEFKLCVTTYDKDDSVRIIKPSNPHPPLYYHLLRNGKHNQQKTPTKPMLSSTEEKELRKIIMDSLGDAQHSKNVNHSSNSSNEERNKGCCIM